MKYSGKHAAHTCMAVGDLRINREETLLFAPAAIHRCMYSVVSNKTTELTQWQAKTWLLKRHTPSSATEYCGGARANFLLCCVYNSVPFVFHGNLIAFAIPFLQTLFSHDWRLFVVHWNFHFYFFHWNQLFHLLGGDALYCWMGGQVEWFHSKNCVGVLHIFTCTVVCKI